ncbi:MAG: hypothetical protein ABF289_03785 [Clostridiales bacterium]
MTKKCFKTIFMVMLVFSLVLVSFGSVSASDYVPPTTPVINSFTSSSTNISSGELITLKWDVSGATKVELIGLEKIPEETLPLVGQLKDVWTTTSTTYVLNAYGENGSMISKAIDVNVDVAGSVEISSFKASSQQIQLGETVMLKWQIKNAKSIELYGIEKLPEKELPAVEGQLEVLPLATTSYVLQAIGFNGEVKSKVLTVSVVDNPVSIKSLSISPEEITVGETATITWSSVNATKVTISGISGDLPANGSIDVKPTKSGNIVYTVTALGKLGDKDTKTISLSVLPPEDPAPKIVDFSASSYSVSRGELVKISWDTTNTTGCTLITSDGITLANRPADGSISLTPNITRSYKLIAYNAAGKTAEKTITITVR